VLPKLAHPNSTPSYDNVPDGGERRWGGGAGGIAS